MPRWLLVSILFFELVVFGNSLAQGNRIDSLKSVIETTKDDSLRVSALLQIGFHYIFNDSEAALKYILEAEEISNKQKLSYSRVSTMSVKGIYFDVSGSLDSASYYFEKGYQLSKEFKFSDLEAKFVNSLGMNNWNRGYYNIALEYFFKVLEVNKSVEPGKRIPLSTPYNNIGLIYQELGQYDKALEYHDKALDYRQKDPALISQVATSFNNIGICLMHLNKFQEAEKAYREGIKVALEHNFLRQYYDLTNNLANTLVAMKRYDEALRYNFEILQNDKKLVLPEKFLMNVNAAVAGIYIQLNQPQKAISHIEQGISIIEKNPDVEFYASDLYKNASTVFYLTGNIERGNFYSRKMTEILEKKFSKKNAESVAEMEVKYNTALKENEILRLRSENEEAELKVTKAELNAREQERILYIIIAISIIILLGLFAWYRWNRMKQNILEEQKVNNAIFLSEQNERVRIARDIHDSIGQKLSVQKMMLSKLNGSVDERSKSDLDLATKLLDETVTELRTISHNLIPQELNLGLVKAINETAEKINDTGNVKVTLNVDKSLEELMSLSADKQLTLYRIVQEIIGNMLRHAQAKHIHISLDKKSDFLMLSVRDDGKGLVKERISNSDGIGWRNIMARTRLMSGKFNIRSELNKGTEVELLIPLS